MILRWGPELLVGPIVDTVLLGRGYQTMWANFFIKGHFDSAEKLFWFFAWCWSVSGNPVKYECNTQQATSVLLIQKNKKKIQKQDYQLSTTHPWIASGPASEPLRKEKKKITIKIWFIVVIAAVIATAMCMKW